MKISDTNQCRLCNQNPESILHLLAECHVSNELWNNVISWIEARVPVTLNLDITAKTIGYVHQDRFFWPLNFFLIITRRYIFSCAIHDRDPNIYCLQNIIKTKYNEQEMLSKVNNTNKQLEDRLQRKAIVFAWQKQSVPKGRWYLLLIKDRVSWFCTLLIKFRKNSKIQNGRHFRKEENNLKIGQNILLRYSVG